VFPSRIDGEGEVAAKPVRAERSIEVRVKASGDSHAEIRISRIDEILEAMGAPLIVAGDDDIRNRRTPCRGTSGARQSK